MDVSPATVDNGKISHSNPSRHACQFPGCTKTFLRKEHLTRHEKSHTAERAFVCHICQRGFNRNDILQRHINRHKGSDGAMERNGRACDACHTCKIKCEGGIPCVSCTKRGIECKIDREEPTAVKDTHVYDQLVSPEKTSTTEATGNVPKPGFQTNGEDFVEQINSFITTNSRNAELLQRPPDEGSIGYHMEISPAASNSDTLNRRMQFDSLTDEEQSLNLNFEDLRFPRISSELLKPTRSLPDSITKEYYECYLTHFHPRWPVIHCPSFEAEDYPYMLKASVEMIGAWIHGTCPSILVALTLHDRLSHHIFQKLHQRSSHQDRYRTWPMPLYQTAALNIIFGFFSGKEEVFSRCILLQSVLLASLREIGFFQAEIVALQEKNARYFPYIMAKQEEKKRLAIALFKVECYISTLRSQPMMLQPDELNFTLPCTYSYWNSAGLHILQQRYPEEPTQRAQESVSSMTTDSSYCLVSQPFLLIEDFQFGLCAIQSDIWRHLELAKDGKQDEMSNLIYKQSLRERLDSWKRIIDQTLIDEGESPKSGRDMHTNLIPIKYYYGLEDHSQPDWKNIVMGRVQALLADARLLYHVLCLNTHTNIRVLGLLAKSKIEINNAYIPQATKEQEDTIRRWTNALCGRESIWQATNILALYLPGNGNLLMQLRLVNGGLDPISHIAVAMAALAVWGYSYYNEKGCDICVGPIHTLQSIELMDTLTRNAELEMFMEVGGRAAIDGLVLCPCNIEKLMDKFRQCLPSGSWKWAMATAIAPILAENR